MNKRLLAFTALSLCLLLSSCGSKNSISGEVVETTPSALILETDNGEQVAVLLEEDVFVWGTDEVDGTQYKAAPHTDVRVSFFPDGRAGSVTAADGTQLKAYHADTYIRIDACLFPDAATLSDGTVLDMWKTNSFGVTYQTKEGVALLREYPPDGPENHIAGNNEHFGDLSEAAKPLVSAFYADRGKLYDLQAELERAWAAYQDDPEEFSPFIVEQRSYPAASGKQIFYFGTSLKLTVSGNVAEEITICDAFDRNTGAFIPLADLFVCPQEDITRNLLDLAEANGSGPADPALKAEMATAFQMEYLNFYPESLGIQFPLGSLPSQEYGWFVSVPFNDGCKALLHPRALPHNA